MAYQNRDEFEVQIKARHDMGKSKDPLERLRLQCLSNGASAYQGLARRFRLMDDDRSRTLNFLEFSDGLKGFGLEITDEETQEIFSTMDCDESGQIAIEEFITKLRPPIKACRKKFIDAAFQLMDKTGDGVITVDDLKGVYDVSKHPKYLNGDWTEERVFLEFIKNFEGPREVDGKVTYDEFFDHYTAISASIDDDSYFSLMMKNSFKKLSVQ